MTTEDKLTEYFEFLDELRESGRVNMVHAASYLQQNFDLSRKEAQAIVSAWRETFDPLSQPRHRAILYINKRLNEHPLHHPGA